MFMTDRLVEIFQRSRSGPFMKEVEFDPMVSRRALELVKEYNITYDPQLVCPSDDDMADRLFEAGVELLTDFGCYHLDTQRVIHFSRSDIMEALRQAPPELRLGEGADMVVATHRGVEDPSP